MEARFARAIFSMAFLLGLSWLAVDAAPVLAAAGYKSKNFVVSAPTPQLAKEIGDTAEMWRKQLSVLWLGKELPPWAKPCPIHAQVAPNMGAGGATSFVFDRGEVFGWNMRIQGSRERILDSVLPHEVTHTIFASYFRRPLPRWADEGACTTVEHRSEIAKQERMLIDFLKTGQGIPFTQMFAMKDYPPNVMPLYSQGHSLTSWLIESRGRTAFLEFLADGMNDENWPRAVRQHYGFDSLLAMQNSWNDWVRQGRPRLAPDTAPTGALVAQAQARTPAHGMGPSAEPAVYRNQSPDDITPIGGPQPQAALPATPAPIASASGSVYAAMAAKTQRARHDWGTAASAGAPAAQSRPSVYDASRTRSGAWR